MHLQAYAMTEASHQMTSNPLPKHGPHKPGTVGRAQGSVQVNSRIWTGGPTAACMRLVWLFSCGVSCMHESQARGRCYHCFPAANRSLQQC